mmetsp:Transcript_25449/g.42448  ORF Transcript_25449/g.42448 Transcript_25449/m.42448 type:complete len:235 (+) Transcript_25449:311-1015(+)
MNRVVLAPFVHRVMMKIGIHWLAILRTLCDGVVVIRGAIFILILHPFHRRGTHCVVKLHFPVQPLEVPHTYACLHMISQVCGALLSPRHAVSLFLNLRIVAVFHYLAPLFEVAHSIFLAIPTSNLTRFILRHHHIDFGFLNTQRLLLLYLVSPLFLLLLALDFLHTHNLPQCALLSFFLLDFGTGSNHLSFAPLLDQPLLLESLFVLKVFLGFFSHFFQQSTFHHTATFHELLL